MDPRTPIAEYLSEAEQAEFSTALTELSGSSLDEQEGIDSFLHAIDTTKRLVWRVRSASRNTDRHGARLSRTSGRLQVFPLGLTPTQENTETPVSMCITRVISALRANPTLSACISTREDGTYLDVRSQLPTAVTEILRYIAVKLSLQLESGVSVEKAPSLVEEHPELKDRVHSEAEDHAKIFAKDARRIRVKRAFQTDIMAKSHQEVLRIARESSPPITGEDLDRLITKKMLETQDRYQDYTLTDELLFEHGYDVTPDSQDIQVSTEKYLKRHLESFKYDGMSRMSISLDGETPLLEDMRVSFLLPEIHPNKKIKKKDVKSFPDAVIFEMMRRASLGENLFLGFGNTEFQSGEDYFFAAHNIAALVKSDSAVFSSVLNTILHRLVNTTSLKGKIGDSMTNYTFRIMTVLDTEDRALVRNPEVLLKIPLRPCRSADIGLEVDFDPENDDDARLEQFVQLRKTLLEKDETNK